MGPVMIVWFSAVMHKISRTAISAKDRDHQHQQTLHLVNIIVGYGTQEVPAIVHDLIATKQHLPNAVHRYGDTALGIR